MVEKEKDIVERLRNPPNSSWYEIMGQAADEIERLRASLQYANDIAEGLAHAALGQGVVSERCRDYDVTDYHYDSHREILEPKD